MNLEAPLARVSPVPQLDISHHGPDRRRWRRDPSRKESSSLSQESWGCQWVVWIGIIGLGWAWATVLTHRAAETPAHRHAVTVEIMPASS